MIALSAIVAAGLLQQLSIGHDPDDTAVSSAESEAISSPGSTYMPPEIAATEHRTADQENRKPVPITNPGNWVRSEDYPSWAIRAGLDGVMTFVLNIDANGVPDDCEITRSTGSPELDKIACSKLLERARFKPATDDRGDNIRGTWSNTVRWQIPDVPSDAPQPGVLEFKIIVEPDGMVSSCKLVTRKGAASEASSKICDGFTRFNPIVDANGVAKRTEIVFRTSVDYREP